MSFDAKSIADRMAIRDVLERYCRGIDRLDADVINSVYWDEAIDDHGIYKGPGKDFAPVVIPILRDNYRCTMHSLHQSLIDLHGKTANVETYFVAYHCGTAEGAEFIDVVGGRYVDVMEERGGEWRIADRTVVIEWARCDKDIEASNFPRDVFVHGRRDRSDIAYGKK